MASRPEFVSQLFTDDFEDSGNKAVEKILHTLDLV